jgi:hypothetical protein
MPVLGSKRNTCPIFDLILKYEAALAPKWSTSVKSEAELS